LDMMKLYVNKLNVREHMLYERQLKEQKEQMASATIAGDNDLVSPNEPLEMATPSEESEAPMNNPNPQNIPIPSPQNIPPLPVPDHSSQNSSHLPPPSSSPSTAARSEQVLEEQRAEQNLNANNLTMSQALELFELLQSRRAADVVKPPIIEAQQVEVAPGRAEPLSFMTLQTVERIIESTDCNPDQGQGSWESKMEKFVNLGHAYSSVKTVTGETCYMVDGELYKNILLAVAAKKQNERSLATATEKLEQHMEQIEHSNDRVMKGEKDALEKLTLRMNRSFEEMRGEQQTRMKNVMADIRALNDSMVASAEHGTNSGEMQRLRVQVERYDQIFPICQAQVKDMEQLNKKLRADLLEEKHRNERMRIRLDKAEALAISFGTSRTSKKGGTDDQEHEDVFENMTGWWGQS
jgi:hypothetical protein